MFYYLFHSFCFKQPNLNMIFFALAPHHLSSNDTLPRIKRHVAPPGFSNHGSIFSEKDEQDWNAVRVHYLNKKANMGQC